MSPAAAQQQFAFVWAQCYILGAKRSSLWECSSWLLGAGGGVRPKRKSCTPPCETYAEIKVKVKGCGHSA